jgi:hypothetical protein
MNEYIDQLIARLRLGWCQKAYFRDEKGNLIKPWTERTHGEGVRCCITGAVILVANKVYDGVLMDRFRSKHKVSVVEFNDKEGRTVEEVIAALEACKDDVP